MLDKSLPLSYIPRPIVCSGHSNSKELGADDLESQPVQAIWLCMPRSQPGFSVGAQQAIRDLRLQSTASMAHDLPHKDLIVGSCEEQPGRWGEPAQMHRVIMASEVLRYP